jgi:hypothetical protein
VLRLNRPARLAATVVIAGLALSGCANKDVLKGAGGHNTHSVRMTVSSNVFAAALTYQLGKSATVDVSKRLSCATSTGSLTEADITKGCANNQNELRFSSTTVTVHSGTHISVTGGAPVNTSGIGLIANGKGPLPTTDTFTCTISVDGVLRATQSSAVAMGEPVPTCTAAGYVGERPFQVSRLLEYLAVGLCLLVVVVGLGVQLAPHRRRA